ncbi:hypothetical protein OGAPHI_000183 [Ogataea philodendri]|uniref:Zn(2)-C6 fungal-type domain-containing protein n=1 Tax=Ogataea philodendri TaxID=1378263 RepID=A0A9P8TAV1_9ASCO|nr:uncharacterized protein OGAPHI_000183 [Ogataea philodendri]KAH3671481.1 hypothetical protein OGAPHI_000183 [Ogataea philodendri]
MKKRHFGPKNLKACKRCFQRKIKCVRNGDDPCSYCQKRNYHCEKRSLVEVYYTVDASERPTVSSQKAFEVLTNSIHFFEFVYRALQDSTSKDLGSTKLHELNINESFVDYSFLKRDSSVQVLEPSAFPDRETAFALFEQAKRTIAFDTQVMLHESTARFISEVYEQGCIVDISNHQVRIEVLRLFALFAIGRLHTSGDVVPEEYPGLKFFRIALSLMNDFYDAPSISYIECLVLIILYLVGLNKLNHAYIHSGTALRLSMLLRLDKPQVKGGVKLSELTKERRRRLWCSVKNLDFYLSWCLGCSSMIKSQSPIDYPNDNIYENELATGFFIRERIKLTELKDQILTSVLDPDNSHVSRFFESFNERSQAINTAVSRLSHVFDTALFHKVLFGLVFRLNECIILATIPEFLQELKPEKLKLLPARKPLNLSKTCVMAAISNLRIYECLFRSNNISIFGFVDTNFLFLSSIVLLLARYLTVERVEFQQVEKSWQDCMLLFDELTKIGNLVANEYLNKIVHLRDLLSILEDHIKPMEDLSLTHNQHPDHQNHEFSKQELVHFNIVETLISWNL